MTKALAELFSDDDRVDMAAARTAATRMPTTPTGSLEDDEQAEHLVVPGPGRLRELAALVQDVQADADQQEQQELDEDGEPAQDQGEPGLAERRAHR